MSTQFYYHPSSKMILRPAGLEYSNSIESMLPCEAYMISKDGELKRKPQFDGDWRKKIIVECELIEEN